MSKSNVQETGYLKLVYQNIALANIGDVSGLQPSGAAGNVYIALHTEDPTETGSVGETTYTSYARVAVPRSVIGWTVSGNTCINAALITMVTSTGGSETVSHFSIKTAITGGDTIHYGALTSNLLITNGITPKFNAGGIVITED